LQEYDGGMPRFRISTGLIFTAIVAVVFVGALRSVDSERRQVASYLPRNQVADNRPPTVIEVAKHMRISLPAAILLWVTIRWALNKCS
jgi:hypothetical protein